MCVSTYFFIYHIGVVRYVCVRIEGTYIYIQTFTMMFICTSTDTLYMYLYTCIGTYTYKCFSFNKIILENGEN